MNELDKRCPFSPHRVRIFCQRKRNNNRSCGVIKYNGITGIKSALDSFDYMKIRNLFDCVRRSLRWQIRKSWLNAWVGHWIFGGISANNKCRQSLNSNTLNCKWVQVVLLPNFMHIERNLWIFVNGLYFVSSFSFFFWSSVCVCVHRMNTLAWPFNIWFYCVDFVRIHCNTLHFIEFTKGERKKKRDVNATEMNMRYVCQCKWRKSYMSKLCILANLWAFNWKNETTKLAKFFEYFENIQWCSFDCWVFQQRTEICWNYSTTKIWVLWKRAHPTHSLEDSCERSRNKKFSCQKQ